MESIEAWLIGLVHPSVQHDAAERSRHERFFVARMTVAALALAGLPPYLLSRGTPSALECLAIITLVAPILAVVFLSRTGLLIVAQGIVSAGIAMFVAAIAVGSGAAPLAWLAFVLVPVEACATGSRRAVVVAAILAILAAGGATIANAIGIPAPEGSSDAALAILTLFFLGHVAAQGFADRRLKTVVRSALRAGEVREGATLQAIGDLVTWHDRNGHVLRANAAATRLFGVAGATLQGRGLLARIHVPDRPLFLKAISDAATSSDGVVVRFRVRKGELVDPAQERGGLLARIGKAAPQMIWVEMRAYRLERPAHGDYAVVAVTRDVSEHQQRVEELEAAREKAEAAGEEKARVLAIVSHELRAPLNAIIGFSEILMSDEAHGKAGQRREYAEIIHDSGQHLLGVIETLLDVAKMDTGHFELKLEGLNVNDLVHSSCDVMEVAANRAGVVIARDVAAGLPEMMGDRRACRQILINLLSNAVKFTPRGGLVVVKAWREEDRIVFSVSDTGIGVAEVDLPRLGNPFFQAGSSPHQADPGSGLGLSVVRGLVGLHRGRIAIASASGDGTSVTVSLPIDGRSGMQSAGPAQVHTIVRPRYAVPALKTG